MASDLPGSRIRYVPPGRIFPRARTRVDRRPGPEPLHRLVWQHASIGSILYLFRVGRSAAGATPGQDCHSGGGSRGRMRLFDTHGRYRTGDLDSGAAYLEAELESGGAISGGDSTSGGRLVLVE